MVESLLEMSTAVSLLKTTAATDGAAGSDSPLDLHYRQLKTTLTPLAHDSDDFALISQYLQNTHAATHRQYELQLLEVFQLEREGEAERYAAHAKDGNRMLLWHGSRTTNYVGILSQGLRIAPPEAPVTGYMFGHLHSTQRTLPPRLTDLSLLTFRPSSYPPPHPSLFPLLIFLISPLLLCAPVQVRACTSPTLRPRVPTTCIPVRPTTWASCCCVRPRWVACTSSLMPSTWRRRPRAACRPRDSGRRSRTRRE